MKNLIKFIMDLSDIPDLAPYVFAAIVILSLGGIAYRIFQNIKAVLGVIAVGAIILSVIFGLF